MRRRTAPLLGALALVVWGILIDGPTLPAGAIAESSRSSVHGAGPGDTRARTLSSRPAAPKGRLACLCPPPPGSTGPPCPLCPGAQGRSTSQGPSPRSRIDLRRIRKLGPVSPSPRATAKSSPNDAQQARLLDAWLIRPIDGDTFAYGGTRIRIRGIDTPEASESGGFEASQRLNLLLREGPVQIVPHATDVYGRTVADVFVNGRNVAEVLTEEGYGKPP